MDLSLPAKLFRQLRREKSALSGMESYFCSVCLSSRRHSPGAGGPSKFPAGYRLPAFLESSEASQQFSFRCCDDSGKIWGFYPRNLAISVRKICFPAENLAAESFFKKCLKSFAGREMHFFFRWFSTSADTFIIRVLQVDLLRKRFGLASVRKVRLQTPPGGGRSFCMVFKGCF